MSVFEWFKHFRDGKEDVEDESLSGRPPTSDNIERVRRMLADERRLCLRMIAEELKISIDSVSNIVHEHLQKRKICPKSVPQKLSNEQKQHRKETSGDFIDACDRNPQFLEKIITVDES
ncbi:hypothetical protein AVEN_199576-1 [Araneus ventricosus]|uniref:Mos1 transposase HTH domain-containing protein n=1 Tax=Araneus ventricosus TaxID=182803 RepID=A0A4Y1ZR05_ARAVE|nr:hypothetical protein AVEN_52371-1 [Araneus ventricosus]GBL63017.1 hypothetical protein AVEN_199576-1 [Araneus ventricosus]